MFGVQETQSNHKEDYMGKKLGGKKPTEPGKKLLKKKALKAKL